MTAQRRARYSVKKKKKTGNFFLINAKKRLFSFRFFFLFFFTHEIYLLGAASFLFFLSF